MAFTRWQWTAALVLALVLAASAVCPAAADVVDVEDAKVSGPADSSAGDKSFPSGGLKNWWNQWGQAAGALAVVIALILGLRFALRRLSSSGRGSTGTAAKAMNVLAKLTPLPRQHLLLVQVGGRLVMVGSGPGGMSRLCEITDPDEVAYLIEVARTGKGELFADLIRKSTDEFESSEPKTHDDPAARRLAEKLRSRMNDKEQD